MDDTPPLPIKLPYPRDELHFASVEFCVEMFTTSREAFRGIGRFHVVGEGMTLKQERRDGSGIFLTIDQRLADAIRRHENQAVAEWKLFLRYWPAIDVIAED